MKRLQRLMHLHMVQLNKFMKITDILQETPFQREEQGLGFEILRLDNTLALVGGWRSGGSPAGLLRCAYQVLDLTAMLQGATQQQADRGIVELYKDDNNDLRGLINIKLNKTNRRAGLGSEIVRACIDTSPGDFTIWDIRKPAIGFWRKMGAEFVDPRGRPVPNPAQYNGQMLVGVIRKTTRPGDSVNHLPGFFRPSTKIN